MAAEVVVVAMGAGGVAVSDVVVAGGVVESRFMGAAVVVGKNVLKDMELVCAAAILSIGVNVILVIGNWFSLCW